MAPPPTIQNSRFAQAADADREYQERRREEFEARGPAPTVQNSRFAAAADADREFQRQRFEEREERRGELREHSRAGGRWGDDGAGGLDGGDRRGMENGGGGIDQG